MALSLFNESLEHGDVILSSYPDLYKKLTYKVLSGYAWARRFCPFAKLIGKLDDDILFNYPRLPLFLRENNFTWSHGDPGDDGKLAEKLPMAVLGPQNPNFKVVRNPGSKWLVFTYLFCQ